ncbi:MAG TPA: acyl-CoA dehydrogenase family protein [Microthrixaceae bacterium]|nr:acyl-CoA dehydrogenase family protein [Microthrixaceae bacterium]HMT24229.1 acyl-CoA dehydrogenase family protein [Microthrixaceae bacterium]HMT59622.1 acyl-CoA dehydrogenase family protein [Microthrixaceae bacterium]
MKFTDEHDQFRSAIRDLVEREINPHCDTWEADGIFPAHDLFAKLGRVGVLGIEYDEAYGGQGADHSFTLVMGEEVGRCHSGGVAMAISVQTDMATPALARFGSHELKERYLAPAMAGAMVAAIAVTEPDAGSDVAGLRTKAVRDGDEWVINGTKLYITNGTQADWLCLLARTSDEGGARGMSQIVVPTDAEGFSVSRKLDKLGQRSSDTAELSFVDVRVPVDNTIGEAGRGFQQQMAQFQNERLIANYMSAANMRLALDRTIAYVKQRRAFGKTLADQQWIQYKLAEVIAEVDVVTHYNHACAEAVVAGADPFTVAKMASIGKLKCGRLNREVADLAMQFHGGIGYMEETWTARYFRDSRLISIGGGADEVMLRIIAQLEGISGDPR